MLLMKVSLLHEVFLAKNTGQHINTRL